MLGAIWMFGVKVKIFSICRYPFYKLKSCKQECASESPIYYYFAAAFVNSAFAILQSGRVGALSCVVTVTQSPKTSRCFI